MQKPSHLPTASVRHAKIIQARLPEWLRNLTADEISALQSFSPSLWNWFDQANRAHPHVTRELLHDYAAYRKSTDHWHSPPVPFPPLKNTRHRCWQQPSRPGSVSTSMCVQPT